MSDLFHIPSFIYGFAVGWWALVAIEAIIERRKKKKTIGENHDNIC